MFAFITGRGNNGSTLLMRLLMECGLNAPSSVKNQPKDKRHGLEAGVTDVATSIDNHLEMNTRKDPEYYIDNLVDPNVSQDHIEQIEHINDECDIAKSPHAQFNLHVWLEHSDIEYVLVCRRNLDVLFDRLEQRDDPATDSEDHFIRNYLLGCGLRDWAIDQHSEVEQIAIHYPTYALDYNYAWDKVTPLLDIDMQQFKRMHNNVVNEDYIRNKDNVNYL